MYYGKVSKLFNHGKTPLEIGLDLSMDLSTNLNICNMAPDGLQKVLRESVACGDSQVWKRRKRPKNADIVTQALFL